MLELCKLFEIPRSSYYKWKNASRSQKQIQDETVAQLILEYHETFDGVLGYRRMRMYINRLNQTTYCNMYIRRLMRVLNIKSRIRIKRSNYIKSKPDQVAENILSRNFNAEYPNQKWCTDVTEFKVPGVKHKLYLSAIIDLFDKSIISYILSNRNDNKLVFDTFKLAMEKNKGVKPILHSDRGFQYTSKQFKFMLNEAGIIQSMSRVGKCIDNGPIEGFFGIIKSESFYGLKFEDEKSLRNKIEWYIDFYNNGRFQERLKNMAPLELRNHVLLNQSINF